MAARFNVGTFGTVTSQLVWFKNPNARKTGVWEGWDHSVLYEGGPDVVIENKEFVADGVRYDVLMAAELWNQRVALTYVVDEPKAWMNRSNIMRTEFRELNGQPFEANFMDVNADGVDEIVVSYYENTQMNEGYLKAWRLFPGSDWRDSRSWEEISIASGFHTNSYIGGNSQSPGKHRLFYPSRLLESI